MTFEKLDQKEIQRRAREGWERKRVARQAQLVDRPCMCCGKTFGSEGIHNRLCEVCRTRSNREGW